MTLLSENQDNSSPNNLVRRMTDILTRMLFRTTQSRPPSVASHSSSESSPVASSHSEDGDIEVLYDSQEGGEKCILFFSIKNF